MQGTFVLGLVGLTSIAATLFAIRGLGWPVTALVAGGVMALELLGAGLVCFVVNLVLGTGTILLARALSDSAVSIYVLNDLALLALSFVQGLALHCWWTASRQPSRATSHSRSWSGSSD